MTNDDMSTVTISLEMFDRMRDEIKMLRLDKNYLREVIQRTHGNVETFLVEYEEVEKRRSRAELIQALNKQGYIP